MAERNRKLYPHRGIWHTPTELGAPLRLGNEVDPETIVDRYGSLVCRVSVSNWHWRQWRRLIVEVLNVHISQQGGLLAVLHDQVRRGRDIDDFAEVLRRDGIDPELDYEVKP